MTAADVERGHRAALATLTPAQRIALGREREALVLTRMRGGTPAFHLKAMFAREAGPAGGPAPKR